MLDTALFCSGSISLSTHRAVIGRPIVLGAACGYSEDQLLPFLLSARAAIPDSLLVLFRGYDDNGPIPHAETIAPPDTWLRSHLRRLPRGTLLASRICLFVSQTLPVRVLSTASLQRASFGVAVARYFWYRDWLLRNPGSPEQTVLLTDTRDVVLQKDPFREASTDRMFCGVEPVKLGDCPINSSWFRKAYGDNALQAIGDKEVLCSGVTGGRRHLILQYLDAMCTEILRIGKRILWSSGYDQAIHNYLLRNTVLGQKFEYAPWHSRLLTTMHYAPPSNFSFDSSGQLLNPAAELIAIVHQYDRHTALLKWAIQRWANSRAQTKTEMP